MEKKDLERHSYISTKLERDKESYIKPSNTNTPSPLSKELHTLLHITDERKSENNLIIGHH